MRGNKLSLNQGKTKVMCVNGSQVQEFTNLLALDGPKLCPKKQLHSLGILLDPAQSLEAQMSLVAGVPSTCSSRYTQLWAFLDC